ncbi:hypothetical protein EDC94DRAFT_639391 [Helicostylum pulchrum]|nr:hypothetical protein EDC94DRAFT_639391 [Helicostylum pulchrum]
MYEDPNSLPQVYVPCNQMKLAVSKKEMRLNAFISSYPKEYTLKKNSIYYDVMATPENHFNAFFELAELSKTEEMEHKIVYHSILKGNAIPKEGSKFEIWGKAVSIKKKAFKHQGFQKTVRFYGTLETDGVRVSIVKQNFDTNRKLPRHNVKKEANRTEYIKELSQDELQNTESNCVLVDPGRQGIMFCLKETSTVGNKHRLICTKNDRSKRSRHFPKAALSTTESKLVDFFKFTRYIKARAVVADTLYEYYGSKSQQSEEVYFPGSSFEFYVNEKCNLYYGSPFVTKIRARQRNYVQKISVVLEKLQILPFRKLKFSSKLYHDQNDNKLVNRLRCKFDQDSVLIFGDWSAPNTRFHEPTRNKGPKDMLKKNGFSVHHINEYKTSSICPLCEHTLEFFKTVPNNRPFRRASMPTVTCHGLLQ